MPSPTRSNFLISPQPPMPHTKMGRILLVLLWKHFTVRKRQFIHTPIEYILPVAFFILLFFTRGLFSGYSSLDEKTNTTEVVLQTPPISIRTLPKPDIVFYSPINDLTDQLMEKVGKSLNLRHMDRYPSYRQGYFGISDKNGIGLILKNLTHTQAYVSFEDMDGTELPKHFKYTIRMKTDFETQIYEAMDDDVGPHRKFGMDYAEFVRLQYAIDTSYLELKTGQIVEQAASIQEFPYVTSTGASTITFVVTLIDLGLYLSLSLVFVLIVIKQVEERASGIQELIKMVGVSTKAIGLSHVINLLPGAAVFSVVGGAMLVSSSTPLLEFSNGFLIGLFMFLQFMSIVALAFASSYVTDNRQHSTSLSIFMYIVFMIPGSQVSKSTVPGPLQPFTGLLPGVPASWFSKELAVLEQFGTGVTFRTMVSSHTGQSLSVAMVFLFLLLQIGIYFGLAWYLSLVRPGLYGSPLPWDFLFRRDYWSKNEVHPDCDLEEAVEREKISTEDKYFEEMPANREVGIEIDNVTKTFKTTRALSHVALPVLKGEITILLGHNGAGKTTLMSIITGMTAATYGNVFVNGMDTVSQQSAVRSQLGFCPQHNLFFNDLTVLEHVMFFSLLKANITWAIATKTSMDLLKQLGLEQKADSLSGQLSGGMQRRLQLACALAGDASVLVLDEPTAGLDVETRRGLWDLLLSLRTGRTVLISTHFMEEADALGDRVAALHRGTLRCHATPMHLKKEVDTGYRLSITMNPYTAPTAATDVSQTITSILPAATQLSESGVRTLAFKLPSRECDKFPELFKKLEESKDKLEIESIGVGVSTLEEVFLKLCSDVSSVAPEDEVDATLQDDLITRKMTGLKLLLCQFAALFMRQIRYAMSSWKLFLLAQVILPILMIVLLARLVNEPDSHLAARNSPAQMDLGVYRNMDGARALSTFDVPKGVAAYTGVEYERSDEIPQTLINIAKDDKFQYNKYLIGVKLNKTDALAYFTTTVRHALPVALNALTNALASSSPAEELSITTINHPVDDAVIYDQIKLKEPKSQPLTILWAVCVAFLIQTTLLNVLILPCKERICNTRHIHVMSGCSPELYWVTSLLYHAAINVLVLAVPCVVCAATLDLDQTISQPDMLFPLFLVLTGGCLSFIALAFLVSFAMNDKAGAIALFAFSFIFCIITPFMKLACDQDTSDSCDFYAPLLTLLAYTMTPQTFVECMLRVGHVARLNAYCTLNKDRCPNLAINEDGFDTEKCCVLNEPPRSYYADDGLSPISYTIALYVQFLILMAAVFLMERGIFSRLRDMLCAWRYAARHRPADGPLRQERAYVEDALSHPRKDALLMSSVHKHYPALVCGKGITAVRGVSFAVQEGECFGLVGVNGAGKSTSFKMMTCETAPTRGLIVANGQRQSIFDNSKYLNGLGYCPQFSGLDEFLTGRQNLELLLTLDGFAADDARREAVRWLELIDLMKYADRRVGAYSGGCGRRLCSVAALARRAGLSLLDEPTAGVDVAARRRLWRAVRAAQHMPAAGGGRRAVLITSHSMDEMEALCGRVGIMSAGVLCALGAPAALRAQHHAGRALAIKVKDTSAEGRLAAVDVTDGPNNTSNPELEQLKEVCLKYQWTPKDEHKTMLHYHVAKELKMEYSELFTKLEELRSAFPALVEDYAVTETTLEQVFLSYARTPADGVV